MRGLYVICGNCGKSTYKSPKSLLHSKSKNYFVTKNVKLVGETNNILGKSKNWINGIRTYINILKRSNAPEICCLCDNNLRILLVAHHIDKNRENNDVTNLVWLCHNCHYLVHNDRDSSEKLLKKLKETN